MIFFIVLFMVTGAAGETINKATIQQMCDNFTLQVNTHLRHIQTPLIICPSVEVNHLLVTLVFSTEDQLTMDHAKLSDHPDRLPHVVYVTTSEVENSAESHLLLEIAKSTFNVPLKDMSTWNLHEGNKMLKRISKTNVNAEL